MTKIANAAEKLGSVPRILVAAALVAASVIAVAAVLAPNGFASTDLPNVPGIDRPCPPAVAKIGKVIQLRPEAHVPQCVVQWITGESEPESISCGAIMRTVKVGDVLAGIESSERTFAANGRSMCWTLFQLVGKVELFPHPTDY